MKFKKIEVVQAENYSDWWARVHHPLFKNVLFVNHAQRPRFKYRLTKGGRQ